MLGVHVGFMNTDMLAGWDDPKNRPSDMAAAVVQTLQDGRSELVFDDNSRQAKGALTGDPELLFIHM